MAWLSIVGVSENNGHPSRIEPAFSSPPVLTAPPAETTILAPLKVAANAFLFRAGDPRTHLYRVETGAICLYETRRGDHQSVIEFLFPGDYVGLGFLDKQHLNARALLDSTVTCHADRRARRRRARTIRARRPSSPCRSSASSRRAATSFTAPASASPIERVAALLVTSARTNVQQGRPAELIKDSWKCGVIAELLQLTLDDLGAILVDLQRRGLIEAAGEDLRLDRHRCAGSDGGRHLAGQRSRRGARAQAPAGSQSRLRGARLEHAEALRSDDRLCARFRRQLLKNALQVGLDCLGCDTELPRDLLIGATPGDELDDRALARRQVVARRASRTASSSRARVRGADRASR